MEQVEENDIGIAQIDSHDIWLTGGKKVVNHMGCMNKFP